MLLWRLVGAFLEDHHVLRWVNDRPTILALSDLNACGVQLVAGRYREDLLLAAGAAIEAAGVPPAPVDPA